MTRPVPATLFSPLRLGAFALAHRVVMPAMSRRQASAAGVPSATMARYYGARATAGGMIICEASAVAQHAARPHAPGLFTAEQVNHWQQVTRAVHERGGIVLAQLDHGSRWTCADDDAPHRDDAALDTAMLAYRNAAEHAGDAGFDGVELLVAHGALPEPVRHPDGPGDEFLVALTGTLSNVWGSDRVGICVSPGDDAQALAGYTEKVRTLHRAAFAFVHVMDEVSASSSRASVALRPASPDGLLVSGGHTRATAIASVESGEADAVGFGRAFVANPDLVDRLRTGAALAPIDAVTPWPDDAPR